MVGYFFDSAALAGFRALCGAWLLAVIPGEAAHNSMAVAIRMVRSI